MLTVAAVAMSICMILGHGDNGLAEMAACGNDAGDRAIHGAVARNTLPVVAEHNNNRVGGNSHATSAECASNHHPSNIHGCHDRQSAMINREHIPRWKPLHG
ncbi:hypothetical protein Z042_04025 [Chania multitudinisentens RB-25]|uniref:Uncharacterized protein n=1 Tax=Chania multitudinisentens RB-25 TaxID=1441930 RepID=W0LJN1_9GAMM|nr:hypothetical protein Z042_04025 [Chania multitudinisentens RB-25]